MVKYIVTISREFGCGAREIARCLASRQNIAFYDKDLVNLTAERAHVEIESIRDYEELLPKGSGRLFSEIGYGSSTAFYSESAVRAQADVIREVADRPGSCILFGRCADFILRDYPNVINFFLYASIEARIRHISETYHVPEKDSEKIIRRVDKQRHNYYKYVTGRNRGDRNDKDLMVNVHTYGLEGTVEMMSHAIEVKFHPESGHPIPSPDCMVQS